mgnify:CR=1 FL=1
MLNGPPILAKRWKLSADGEVLGPRKQREHDPRTATAKAILTRTSVKCGNRGKVP